MAAAAAVGSSLLPPQLHGLLGFALVFVALQLTWHLLDLSDLLHAPSPLVHEKTIVILDGSKMVNGGGEGGSAEEMLSRPLSVATFDSEGSRTDNDWERARRKEREEKRKAERKEARKKKKSQPPPPQPEPEPEPEPESEPVPVPEPGPELEPELPAIGAEPAAAAAPRSVAVSVAASGATDAIDAANASEACAPNATAAAATAPPEDAGPSPPPQLLSHQHRWWETPPTPPLPLPPPSASPAPPTMSPVVSPAAEAEAEAEGEAEAEAEGEVEAVAEAEVHAADARRPSYVWAQNRSFVFVTASVPRASARAPPAVRFAARSAEVAMAAERGEAALELQLELLRRISPEGSSWEATSRGPLLRLKKARPAHWARLLAEEGHDARQGTDWKRWHHPEVERAAQRDADKDEYARRSHARRKAIKELL